MKRIIYLFATFFFLTLSIDARQDNPSSAGVTGGQDSWQKWGPTAGLKAGGVIVRAGYVIGGTTPLPLPAEIRKINEFSPRGGISLGIDGYRMISKRWGISLGAHFFWEGFHTGADVKNYYVWLETEGEITKGYFTGTNVTNTGEVYDNKDGIGYLREDSPVGNKILMSRETPTPYPDDFADHMLPLNVGIEIGGDWKALPHMNVFGKLDWGLTNIWSPSFEAISFRMYPIYATIGVAYRY